jgi:virulence factor
MHRLRGAAEEHLQVMGDGGGRRVIDLAEVVRYGNGDRAGMTITRRGDWTPVARQRGIEQICATFLDAVRSGTLLSAEDALATHAICEQIVTRADG